MTLVISAYQPLHYTKYHVPSGPKVVIVTEFITELGNKTVDALINPQFINPSPAKFVVCKTMNTSYRTN